MSSLCELRQAYKPAVPQLFGLRTPFAVKYFSRTSGGLANTKDINPYYAKKPTVKIRKAMF